MVPPRRARRERMSLLLCWVGGTFIAAFGAVAIWVVAKLALVSVEPALADPKSLSPEDRDRDAILAASFNPPHLGHVMLLRAIARRHPGGKVYAVVAGRASKRYRASPQERCALLARSIQGEPGLENVVPVVTDQKYVWR